MTSQYQNQCWPRSLTQIYASLGGNELSLLYVFSWGHFLAFGYCHCLRLPVYVHPCVNHELVCMITWLIGPWEIWRQVEKCYIQTDWQLRHSLWNFSQVNVKRHNWLVQIMAWCRQATSHYLNHCWPRSMSPYSITRPQWVKHLFKLGSPNLDQSCKIPWLRSLLCCGIIGLDLQGQIELKSKNIIHFELVHDITSQQLKLGFPNLDQKCIVALLRSF